jgi:hypothetical protein
MGSSLIVHLLHRHRVVLLCLERFGIFPHEAQRRGGIQIVSHPRLEESVDLCLLGADIDALGLVS